MAPAIKLVITTSLLFRLANGARDCSESNAGGLTDSLYCRLFDEASSISLSVSERLLSIVTAFELLEDTMLFDSIFRLAAIGVYSLLYLVFFFKLHSYRQTKLFKQPVDDRIFSWNIIAVQGALTISAL
uniref:Secreted protein n=1 Tax=Anopheles darlingi TaxID=43151 RepID=A0A2M4DN96_ANODA